MDIVPFKERCWFCRKRKATKLCDFVVGYLFTSIDFKKSTQTCDRQICDECATELGDEFHFCPLHVKITQEKLGIKTR